MEKVPVEISGHRKILRAEPSFCKHCRDYRPHVFVKRDFLPSGMQGLLPHGTVHICLSCLEVGNYLYRQEPIFQEISLVQTQVLEMATVPIS